MSNPIPANSDRHQANDPTVEKLRVAQRDAEAKRRADIIAAVNAKAVAGLLKIRMHHGAVVTANIQSAIIAITRGDAELAE